MPKIPWEKEIEIIGFNEKYDLNWIIDSLFQTFNTNIQRFEMNDQIYDFQDYIEDILITYFIYSNCKCILDEENKYTHQKIHGLFDGIKYELPINCSENLKLLNQSLNQTNVGKTNIYWIDPTIFDNSSGNYTKVLEQINNCYNTESYDACAVMIRKLIEMLIVGVYEANDRISKIKDAKKEIFKLKKLIDTITDDKKINLGKDCKIFLKNAKFFGDKGAHSRRGYVTKRSIVSMQYLLELTCQELLSHIVNSKS